MDNALYQTLALAALAGFLVAGAIALRNRPQTPAALAWLAPAGLSAALLAWSALTVAREGPIGFWPHHLQDAWGVQIWFDLLLGIGSAFALLVPNARSVGMRPAPWLIVVACTGSIGLLAMLSRYLFLAQAQGAARAAS